MNKVVSRLLIFFVGIPLIILLVCVKAYNHLALHIALCFVSAIAANELYTIFNVKNALLPRWLIIICSMFIPVVAMLQSILKSRIQVDGATSNCVGSSTNDYRLIVKAANNNQDPNSFIQILKFEVNGNKRRCVIAKSNTFGGSQAGAEEVVTFQGKKYGSSAYLLNIPSNPGEYGVIVTDPNNKTEKNMTVYCYSIK